MMDMSENTTSNENSDLNKPDNVQVNDHDMKQVSNQNLHDVKIKKEK